ncbi:hypothetical protein D3C87_840180 [compost metagenome]
MVYVSTFSDGPALQAFVRNLLSDAKSLRIDGLDRAGQIDSYISRGKVLAWVDAITLSLGVVDLSSKSSIAKLESMGTEDLDEKAVNHLMKKWKRFTLGEQLPNAVTLVKTERACPGSTDIFKHPLWAILSGKKISSQSIIDTLHADAAAITNKLMIKSNRDNEFILSMLDVLDKCRCFYDCLFVCVWLLKVNKCQDLAVALVSFIHRQLVVKSLQLLNPAAAYMLIFVFCDMLRSTTTNAGLYAETPEMVIRYAIAVKASAMEKEVWTGRSVVSARDVSGRKVVMPDTPRTPYVKLALTPCFSAQASLSNEARCFSGVTVKYWEEWISRYPVTKLIFDAASEVCSD